MSRSTAMILATPISCEAWARLVLRDTERPEEDRKKGAAAIWRRLLVGRGGRPDAAATEQVADLFRQAGMTDDALELYRQAVAIRPDDPGARTHLGEFLHGLGRRAEALEAWRGITAGAGPRCPQAAGTRRRPRRFRLP